MSCDVCGRQMQAMYQSSRKTEWVCRWCYATTHVGIYPGEVLRPPYSYRVWERANVDDLRFPR
ncbi:hypothetical protein GCM10009679_77740 [Saccharothrix algeriensis]